MSTCLVALVLAATAAEGTTARPDHPLSLDEAVQRALARNFSIAIERESLIGAREGVVQAEGAYDFNFAADSLYRDHTDPLNSLFSGAPPGEVAAHQKGLDFSTSFSRLLGTGGTVSLLAEGGHATTNGLLSLLSPAYQTSIGLELRQPLLRDRATDPTRTAIKVARTEKDRSVASLKAAVSDTLALVEAGYWNLAAAARDVTVRQQAVELARAQLEETRARIGAGILPENELAQPKAELERRRGDLYSAQERAMRAENNLKALILGDATGEDVLWNERLVPSDPPKADPRPVDLAAALARAAEERPEVVEAKAALAGQGFEVASARDGLKPRLDVVAGYARRGLAGTQNPNAVPIFGGPLEVPPALDGGLGRSYGTLFDGLYPDATLGLSFSVPIGNHAAKAGAAIAEVNERQAALALARTRQRVQVEVRNAAVSVEANAQRIDATRAAREAAEVQLQSEQERFGVGLSTNFLVLTRQNDLSEAQLQETSAYRDYLIALAEFARAEGTLLSQRGVTISESTASDPVQRAAGGSR